MWGGEGAKGRHNLFICQRPNRKRGSSGDQEERGERKKENEKLEKERNEKLRGIRRRRKDKGRRIEGEQGRKGKIVTDRKQEWEEKEKEEERRKGRRRRKEMWEDTKIRGMKAINKKSIGRKE